MAIALTEKEKAKLRELGKITEQQIKDAEVNDVAPPYYLACQFIAREERTRQIIEAPSALPPVSRETRLTGFAAKRDILKRRSASQSQATADWTRVQHFRRGGCQISSRAPVGGLSRPAACCPLERGRLSSKIELRGWGPPATAIRLMTPTFSAAGMCLRRRGRSAVVPPPA
jgi:hypothetical protein